MIALSGLWLLLAIVALVLGALLGPAWAYASLLMTLVAAALLTLGVGRLAHRADFRGRPDG
jgi:hypothetical protein